MCVFHQGYKNIMENCAANAKALGQAIVDTGRFKLLSKEVGVPVVAFSLKDRSEHDEFEIADGLRRYGWTVPAYTMAPNAEKVSLLRVVVREDFSRSLGERLVTDLKRVLQNLDGHPSKLIKAVTAAVQEEHPELAHKGAVTARDVKKSAAFNESIRNHVHPKKHSGHKKHLIAKTNGVC
jgi:glutamate decarboxylase